jgi:hypothetical protein
MANTVTLEDDSSGEEDEDGADPGWKNCCREAGSSVGSGRVWWGGWTSLV